MNTSCSLIFGRAGRALLFPLFLSLLLLFPRPSVAIEDPSKLIPKLAVAPNLGSRIDLDLPFVAEDGSATTIRQLILKDRPVLIVPAYYTCPRLCGLLLDGVTKLLNGMALTLGSDFSVVTVSFDPEDTTERAATKAQLYRSKLTVPGAQSWHFLTGTKASIDAFMGSLGFRYEADGDEWAHAAAIFMVTPQGTISNFQANIEFDPKVVRYSLIEASQGTVGSPLDQMFLFCFRYDHLQGKYVWAAFGLMRAGGILTLSFLVFLIYSLWSRERRKSAEEFEKTRA